MTSGRLAEIVTLAEGGDEDVALQVASEIALMPEDATTLRERLEREADAEADTFATAPTAVTDGDLAAMAEEAGF